MGKQCRERWYNHLNPNVNKTEWSEEEEWVLYILHKRMGNHWSQISKELPGRTDNTIKNHWNSTMQKKIKYYNNEYIKQIGNLTLSSEISLFESKILKKFSEKIKKDNECYYISKISSYEQFKSSSLSSNQIQKLKKILHLRTHSKKTKKKGRKPKLIDNIKNYKKKTKIVDDIDTYFTPEKDKEIYEIENKNEKILKEEISPNFNPRCFRSTNDKTNEMCFKNHNVFESEDKEYFKKINQTSNTKNHNSLLSEIKISTPFKPVSIFNGNVVINSTNYKKDNFVYMSSKNLNSSNKYSVHENINENNFGINDNYSNKSLFNTPYSNLKFNNYSMLSDQKLANTNLDKVFFANISIDPLDNK